MIKKKVLPSIILYSCIIIFFYSLSNIFLYMWDSYKVSRQRKIYAELYDTSIFSIMQTENKENIESISVKKNDSVSTRTADNAYHKLNEKLFKEFEGVNPDFTGILIVPNTIIKYPVVKYSDNTHYLNTGFDGKKSKYGTLFIDCDNNVSMSDKNTVIYGHNMKDGQMFGSLASFKKQSFYDENRYIYFDTLDGLYKWEVFSVFIAGKNSDYQRNDFKNNDEFKAFFQGLQGKSLIQNNIKIDAQDRILTLSTCDYSFTDARLVVQARLVT